MRLMVAGTVRVAVLLPVAGESDQEEPPLVLTCHWYVRPVPVAFTMKLALFPAIAVRSWGCNAMASTVRAMNRKTAVRALTTA